jgi:hypothetical protein
MLGRTTLRICRILCFVVLFPLCAPISAVRAQTSPAASDSKNVAKTDKEDWNTLSLPKAVLQHSEPLLVELDDDNTAFTREYLSIEWRAGDPIHLFVIKPKGVKKPPVILYLYSYPSETDRFLNDDFCKFLTKNGYAAVGFVSALTGHRYHDRPMREWFISELQEALGSSVHDVQMILNYLSTRNDLDVGRIGMFGDGSGATIAILSAAADARIKVLDLLDPWGDWPNWLAKSTLIPEEERPDYLKPEFMKSLDTLDPMRCLPGLTSRVMRLQNVSGVSVTPDTVKQHIASVAPASAQIVDYDDVKAFLKNASNGTGFDWIKERVRQVAPAEQMAAGKSHKSQGSKQTEKKDR